jgi:hypothetical protein
MTRSELATQLTIKAWKDAEFRNAVTIDPKRLLEEQLGRKLPEQVRIFVHEEDAQTIHFSIPLMPSAVADLSDDELERVAAGTEIALVVGGVLTAAMATGAIATGAVVGVQHGW